MTERSTQLDSEFWIIVDHEFDTRAFDHWRDTLGNAANLFHRATLRADLNQVRTSVTQLFRYGGWIPAVQVGTVYKGIEQACLQRLHCSRAPLPPGRRSLSTLCDGSMPARHDAAA